jgi:hypothetical protein
MKNNFESLRRHKKPLAAAAVAALAVTGTSGVVFYNKFLSDDSTNAAPNPGVATATTGMGNAEGQAGGDSKVELACDSMDVKTQGEALVVTPRGRVVKGDPQSDALYTITQVVEPGEDPKVIIHRGLTNSKFSPVTLPFKNLAKDPSKWKGESAIVVLADFSNVVDKPLPETGKNIADNIGVNNSFEGSERTLSQAYPGINLAVCGNAAITAVSLYQQGKLLPVK